MQPIGSKPAKVSIKSVICALGSKYVGLATPIRLEQPYSSEILRQSAQSPRLGLVNGLLLAAPLGKVQNA
jgi:hypothetical protein